VPWIKRLTADIISDIAFGIDFDALDDPDKEYSDKV
jgi:hypothetical protein